MFTIPFLRAGATREAAAVRARLRAAACTAALAGAALAGAALALSPLVAPTATALPAQPAAADEMERPEVRKVRFEGTQAIAAGTLRDALATKASSCNGLASLPFCAFTKSKIVYTRRYLDRTELARDVVRALVVYYKRGWRDAQVDTTVRRVGPNQVDVTFRVTEGAPTRVTALAVRDPTGTLRPRARARLVAPRVGDPLNLLQLDSSVVRLRDWYWERGYGDATVARPAVAVDDSADTAAVALAVARGPRTPISRIDIVRVGAQRRVSDETIRRSLLIEPGDLFRRSRVAESQRALYESGLFRSALIDTAVGTGAGSGATVCAQQASLATRPAARAAAAADARAAAGDDSSKALVVCVVEGPLREARTSAGFSTADFFQVDARFTHNYWLGEARRLDVSGVLGNLGAQQLFGTFPFSTANGFNFGDDRQDRLSQTGRYFAPTYQAGVDVRQRWVGDPRNTAATGAFVHRRSSPGVFVDRGLGGHLTFTRELARQLPLSGTYRFEVSRVDAGDVYFCVNFGVCDDRTVRALQAGQRLSPIAVTASANRANHPFSPTRGVVGRFEAEHASRATLSDFAYNRITLEGSAYRRVPLRRGVLAVHGRAGWVAALDGTNRALGIAQGDEVLHPRKRFYAGGARSVRGFGENQLGPRVLTVSPDAIRGRRDTTIAGEKTAVYDCPEPAALAQCFAQRRGAIPDDDFTPRPLGGTVLLEGNVELRVPIWRQLWGAVFLDGAMLGERSFRDLTGGTGTTALTPGVGVRYVSPVGPIRVDLGIRPTLQEELPVVTEEIGQDGTRRLLDLSGADGCRDRSALQGCRVFPVEGATGGVRGLLRRITLHLSIGEAF